MNASIAKKQFQDAKTQYYEDLDSIYMSTAYKSKINEVCTHFCIKSFQNEEFTKRESNCLAACFNKAF